MYGVVLWSDTKKRKAVIWCEDHGDLAFYRGSRDSAMDAPTLDAGDLVHFQVNDGAALRTVTNPRLIAEHQYPGLADRLRAKGPAPRPEHDTRTTESKQDNVISFRPRQAREPALSFA